MLQKVARRCQGLLGVKEEETPYNKPAAYETLKFYQNICKIRRLVYQITERFKKTHIRLISQMRDAARSAKQNIREGYRRGTIGDFIRSIKISQGSLEELMGDIEDCYEDGLIQNQEFNLLRALFLSARYMSDRYLLSLYEMERKGLWKTPKRSR